MESVILVLHVLVALAMIGLILLQQGKGAEMGASFGAGASQTVFGAAGAVGFLVKFTATLALIFFVTSLTLAVYAKKHAQTAGVIPTLPAAAVAPAASDVPAAPVGNSEVPVLPVLPTK